MAEKKSKRAGKRTAGSKARRTVVADRAETARGEGAGVRLFTSRWIYCVAVIVFVALTVILYRNSIDTPFQFDDNRFIVENKDIRDLGNLGAILNSGSPKRPVLMLTIALNYHFAQIDPEPYHLVNVTIHALNGIIVYLIVFVILSRIVRDRARSLRRCHLLAILASCLFLCHPVNTESVTYVWGRSGILFTFCYLLSFLSFLRSAMLVKEDPESGRVSRPLSFYVYFALSMFLFLLALGTKATAVTLPVLLLVFDYFFLAKRFSVRWLAKSIGLYSLYFAAVVIRVACDSVLFKELKNKFLIAFNKSGDPEVLDFYSNFLTQCHSTLHYIKTLLFPFDLNADHHFLPSRSIGELPVLLSIGAMLVLLAATLWLFRRNRLLSFSLVWFIVSISFFFLVPLADYHVERRMYLPSICYSLFLVGIVEILVFRPEGMRKKNLAVATIAVVAVILLLFSIRTVTRNAVYRTTVTFNEDIARKSPDKPRAHNNLGLAYRNHNRVDDAIRATRRAVELNPASAKFFYNLGICYRLKGQEDKALEALNKCVARTPGFRIAHFHIGMIHFDIGQWHAAISKFKGLVHWDGADTGARNYLGLSYYHLEDLQRAREQFLECLSIDSRDAEALNNLGLVFLKENDLDSAEESFRKAIEFNPKFARAYNNLGLIFIKKKDVDKAILHLSQSVRHDPSFGNAHFNLAMAYYSRKDYESAGRHTAIAHRLGVVLPPAFRKLIGLSP